MGIPGLQRTILIGGAPEARGAAPVLFPLRASVSQ